MKTLLNTSFFCSPAAEQTVMQTLCQRWISACNAVGEAPAMLLRMPPEEGIVRLAVQTPFIDAESAEKFRTEILEPIGAELLKTCGENNYTHFSTLMEIIQSSDTLTLNP
ncbi:MAG: hypothetical protein NC301_08335 [Bacteroides sp.]|nr:hypothetical protein [Bacteroides sp.]MCM1445626.1 hypothetical protein [Prevotella sp.]